MNWNKLREILNTMAESDDENAKALLDAQVIVSIDASGSLPVHLAQSLVDGELILLAMEVVTK